MTQRYAITTLQYLCNIFLVSCLSIVQDSRPNAVINPITQSDESLQRSLVPPMSSIRTMTSQVRVGIGIFVFNAQNKFILGERTGSHGAGMYRMRSIAAHSLTANQALTLFRAVISRSANRSRNAQLARYSRRQHWSLNIFAS